MHMAHWGTLAWKQCRAEPDVTGPYPRHHSVAAHPHDMRHLPTSSIVCLYPQSRGMSLPLPTQIVSENLWSCPWWKVLHSSNNVKGFTLKFRIRVILTNALVLIWSCENSVWINKTLRKQYICNVQIIQLNPHHTIESSSRVR